MTTSALEEDEAEALTPASLPPGAGSGGGALTGTPRAAGVVAAPAPRNRTRDSIPAKNVPLVLRYAVM